ncbi:MAG: diguanylate cyclase [Bacillota bacterium]|nr:diguanylate cyclase [Bacillota bacterium]
MYRLLRNIYLLALITVIIFVIGWYYQHYSTNRVMLDSTRQIAELSVQTIHDDVGSWIKKNARTIEAAADYISMDRWNDNDILGYLTILLEKNDDFSSIYFGTTDNRMINASGWQMPPGFELRSRPWYSKAVDQKNTIITEAFVNASNDKLIITIACPVFNSNGSLIGVVGGDIDIKQIIALINLHESTNGGYSFLVDGKGNILAHPDFDYAPDTGLVTLQTRYGNLENSIPENGMDSMTLDESKGFLAYLPIADTNWHLATFIPESNLNAVTAKMRLEFMFAGAATILVFILFLLYHHFYVHKPLLIFEKNIKNIDIEKDLSYRLPLDKYNEFTALGKTINHLLGKAQVYFESLQEKEQSLSNANSRLDLIGKQLTTIEEALDYSEEKLYYLSYHDQLSGLYNRSFFEAKLHQLSEKPDYPTSIITIDIDGLKLINDTIGHSAGDRLLKTCAKLISESLDGAGILARVGGDEFSAILPLTGKYEAESIARQIRYQVYLYNQNHSHLPLSISIGVATAKDGSESLKKLYKQADDLMFRDKLYRSTSARNGIVRSLMAALAERDYFTEDHAKRLEQLCLKMGEKIGLTSNQLTDLALLAKVHDLGKVGIPDQILFKPGPLNDEEWQVMKQHPEKGYRIASTSSDLTEVADLILKHHEHWDGGGYPMGLKEEEIPIECRILAIVDAYDTMTNTRPYKDAVSHNEALTELEMCSGKQFDPNLVEIFKLVVKDN